MFIIAFVATPESATSADYGTFPSSGQVTFTGTETSQTITLPIPQDTTYEGTEQFLISISVDGVDNYLGDLSKATVMIYDDDPAPSPNEAGR